MESYMCSYMELLLLFFGMELNIYTCWNILSALSCLRKLVDYQWNTIYIFVCILERLPGYVGNWKEVGHG